jgi:hypothetical protein
MLYLHPKKIALKKNKTINRKGRGVQVGWDEQTEVMPARAPLANRVGVSNCFFPFEVNHWGECHPT